jgi:hypothetical protein
MKSPGPCESSSFICFDEAERNLNNTAKIDSYFSLNYPLSFIISGREMSNKIFNVERKASF